MSEHSADPQSWVQPYQWQYPTTYWYYPSKQQFLGEYANSMNVEEREHDFLLTFRRDGVFLSSFAVPKDLWEEVSYEPSTNPTKAIEPPA